MKSLFLDIFKVFFLYLSICISLLLMFSMVAEYSTFDDQIGFLLQKQEYLHIGIWKFSFYAHVFSSSFCLLAGFTQYNYPHI